MELLQLQYFQVIARTQNISAAAAQLHISQPSLSQILKRLEQEAGAPLFDRVGKRIVLNAYGTVFLKHVEEAFTALDNATTEIRLCAAPLPKQSTSAFCPPPCCCPTSIRRSKKPIPLSCFISFRSTRNVCPDRMADHLLRLEASG